MERTATATGWGSSKEGRGELGSESGALGGTPSSFPTRFGDSQGTNPEELLGAAHAGHFSMALSNVLKERGIDVELTATLVN